MHFSFAFEFTNFFPVWVWHVATGFPRRCSLIFISISIWSRRPSAMSHSLPHHGQTKPKASSAENQEILYIPMWMPVDEAAPGLTQLPRWRRVTQSAQFMQHASFCACRRRRRFPFVLGVKRFSASPRIYLLFSLFFFRGNNGIPRLTTPSSNLFRLSEPPTASYQLPTASNHLISCLFGSLRNVRYVRPSDAPKKKKKKKTE